jgi:hypothetical protein
MSASRSRRRLAAARLHGASLLQREFRARDGVTKTCALYESRLARAGLVWLLHYIRSDFFRQHNQSEDRLRLSL